MQKFIWLYFSLKGRLARKDFWLLYILPAVVIGLASHHVANIFNSVEVVGDFIAIGFLWPSIAIQVKRWHDVNKSGWWLLINLIPFLGTLWALIENGFFSGTPTENNYGPATSNVGTV